MDKIAQLASVRPKLVGRLHGVKNKSTEIRNEAIRTKLLENDKVYKLVDYIFEKMDEGTLRPAEAIKAFATFSPFLFQTLSEQTTEEVIDRITSKAEAEEEIQQIQSVITALKAVK